MANANSVFHRSALPWLGMNRPLLSAFASIPYLPILAANRPFVARQFVSGQKGLGSPSFTSCCPSGLALIAASAGIGYSQASWQARGRRQRRMSYGTLPSKMLYAVDTWPSPRAQMFHTSSGWKNISSEEFLRRTAGLSQALFELGVKPGDRVGLFCANRPEWHTADFAINGNGAVTVPVYFKESPDR